MSNPEKQHVQVYKLTRSGYPNDILGIIALYYNDGVIVDSLEISPHSRRMPAGHRKYINLCDIMIAFAAKWGSDYHGDSFIGLIPKDGPVERHYIRKYNARPIYDGARMYNIYPTVTSRLVNALYYR